jgi:hypothetical protein
LVEGTTFWEVMNVRTEDLDPQQRFTEKEQARRADLEALRSGRKTKTQLKRETEVFVFPSQPSTDQPGRISLLVLSGGR